MKKNCIVVRWVDDARGDIQPAFWTGNKWVLEYPDAAKLSRRDALRVGRALVADVYADWGRDSERALLALDSDRHAGIAGDVALPRGFSEVES